jgi:manganese efflux pump family protein
MTATILLFGLLAGLDNLQVCSSIGLAEITRRRLHRLAIMFALCETLAPLVGVLGGKAFLNSFGGWSHVAGPAVVIACGISIFYAAMRRTQDGLPPAGVVALPMALCLDNVVAGAGLSAIGEHMWFSALCIGLTSATMSCAGLYAAARIRCLLGGVPRLRVETAAAGYLVVLALRMFAEKVG